MVVMTLSVWLWRSGGGEERRSRGGPSEPRRLPGGVGLSAASAVQVFVLGAGLAKVHESGVCLEAAATCRTRREMNVRVAVHRADP